MRSIKFLPGIFVRRPGLAVILAALFCAATGLADRFPPDPVEDLRLGLKSLTPDPDLPKNIEALRSLSDMRKALDLQEWRVEAAETDKVADAHREARAFLAERFKKGVRRVLHEGTPPARLAVMAMLAEMGTSVRPVEISRGTVKSVNAEALELVLTDETGKDKRFTIRDDIRIYFDGGTISIQDVRMGDKVRIKSIISRAFGPDLADLVKKADITPATLQTAAPTLGLIFPDPDVAVRVLDKLLASPSVAERRAAANGLASFMRVASQLSAKKGTGLEAERSDVVQAGCSVLPVAGRGLGDSDVEVRRLCAEAIQHTAAAMYHQVPLPPPPRIEEERGRGGLQDGPGVLERARNELQPLRKAFEQQAGALKVALSDPDLGVRLEIERALEELGRSRQQLFRRTVPNSAPAKPAESREARAAPRNGGALVAVANKVQAAAQKEPLLEMLPTILPALEANLADPNVNVLARLGAIDVLEMFGSTAAQAGPALVKALADPDRFVRWAAARTLGKMSLDKPVEADTAVPALARLLFDGDLDVRRYTAVALERYGPAAEAAVPDLIRAVTTASDAEMQIAAMRSLEGIGTGAQPAVPALSARLADPDSRVRQTAAEVLGKFGSLASQAEPALRRALDDPNPEVRRAVSDALLNVLSSGK